MIRKGDVIENPVTGERMRFVETSCETKGERVVVEVWVEPGGAVAAAHVHPKQTERFTVAEGVLGMKVAGREVELRAGESLEVEPGTPHKFWNAGDGSARFFTTITPALGFEQLLETMFALAADGKTNRRGMPNPFRLAVIADEHFDDVRLPIPAWIQKAGLAVGAPLGRLLGYEATYPPAKRPQLALA